MRPLNGSLKEQWLDEARGRSLDEPTAMTLATADQDGQPAARIVLLRNVDPARFCLQEVHEFAQRQGAPLGGKSTRRISALCFYWDPLGRQIRIKVGEGLVVDAN